MKNAIWGRIAKAVDKAMAAKPPGNIESHHVEHIVNAILDYALPFQQQVDKTNVQSPFTGEKTEQHSDGAQAHKADRPQGKTGTWADVGRGGAANNLALQYAFEKECDLILIQEPWIGKDLDRRISKKHIGFQAYAPEDQ